MLQTVNNQHVGKKNEIKQQFFFKKPATNAVDPYILQNMLLINDDSYHKKEYKFPSIAFLQC